MQNIDKMNNRKNGYTKQIVWYINIIAHTKSSVNIFCENIMRKINAITFMRNSEHTQIRKHLNIAVEAKELEKLWTRR